MAKTETLHIRVNENVKANAEKTLEKLGLSISEAVNMFLCQVQLRGGIPFEVQLPPAPEELIVHSIDELYEKLVEAEEDIKAGRFVDGDKALAELREKYGV